MASEGDTGSPPMPEAEPPMRHYASEPDPDEPGAAECAARVHDSQGRVPSLTPPKPPPPYSYGPDMRQIEAGELAAARTQLHGHFRRGAVEGVAYKYEAAVTECAALRRQVHSLKLQLAAGVPLPPSESIAAAPSLSPPRSMPRFESPEEEALWQAFNVDVATKLDAVDKVAKMRTEFDSARRELQQELAVKEEVLRLLTEQLKGMVERSQLHRAQEDLDACQEELRIARERSDEVGEENVHLRQRCDELSLQLQQHADALRATVTRERELARSAVDDARRRVEELESAVATSEREASNAREAVRDAQQALAAERIKAASQVQEHFDAETLRAQLEEKEGVVRELAESLQKQALSHKRVLAEAQEREAELQAVMSQRDRSREVMLALQGSMEQRDTQAQELAERLAARDSEAAELRERLAGWQQHLNSHLLRKDEELQRLSEEHAQELKLLRLRLTEADTRARVLRHLADREMGDARAASLQRSQEAAERDDALRRVAALQEELRRAQAEAEASVATAVAATARAEARAEHAERQLRAAGAPRREGSSSPAAGELDSALRQIATEQEAALRLRAEADARVAEAEARADRAEQQLAAQSQPQSLQRDRSPSAAARDAAALRGASTERSRSAAADADAQQVVGELTQLAAEWQRRASRVELQLHEERQQSQNLRDRLSAQVAELAAARDTAAQRADRAALEAALAREERDGALRRAEEAAAREQEAQTAAAEIGRTREALTGVAQTLEEVERQLRERDAALREYEGACERKDAELASLRALLQKSSETLDRFQSASDARNADTSERVERLAAELRAEELARRQAEHEAAAAGGEAADLRAELLRVREEGEGRGAAQREELARAQEELLRARRQMQELQEQQVAALRGAAAQREGALRLAGDRLAALEGAEAAGRREREAAAAECEQARACAEELRRQHDAWVERGESWRLAEARLREELTAARASEGLVETLRSKLAAAEAACSSERQQCDATRRAAAMAEEAALRASDRARALEDQAAQERGRRELQAQLALCREESQQRAMCAEARAVGLADLTATLASAAAGAAAAAGRGASDRAALAEQLDRLRRACSDMQAEAGEAARRGEEERMQLRQQLLDREAAQAAAEAAARHAAAARDQLEEAAGRREKLLLELSARMDAKSHDMGQLHDALEAHVQQAHSLREMLTVRERELLAASQEQVSVRKEAERKAAEYYEELRRRDHAEQTLRRELSEAAARADSLSRQVGQLEEACSSLRERLSAATRERDNMQAAAAGLRGELDASGLALQQVSTDAARSAAQCESLQRALAECEARLRQQETEAAAAAAHREEALRDAVTALQQSGERSAAASQLHTQLRGQLDEAMECIGKLEAKVREQDLELHQQRADRDAALRRAESRIEVYEQEAAAARAHAESAARSHAEASAERSQEGERAIAAMREELMVRESMISQLQGALDAARENVVPPEARALHERTVQSLEAEAGRLRGQLTQKTQQLAEAQGNVAARDGDLARLAAALHDEAGRVARLNQRVCDQHATLSEASSARWRAEAALAELRGACCVLADHYRALEARFCSPYITPMADGWDSEEAAAFVRQVKQWVIAHSAQFAAGAESAGQGAALPLRHPSPPALSPPRGLQLVAQYVSPSADGHRHAPAAAMPPPPPPQGSSTQRRRAAASEAGTPDARRRATAGVQPGGRGAQPAHRAAPRGGRPAPARRAAGGGSSR
eukprot:TRINITY_DN4772_c0_g1_i1.p1 TRINITY_DN4772_c0_g1~~TRINITY_DN4772_c0_g1_i1.p1  ORF type:complete len:1755 (+),score=714.61 TRINITY_DN4772_c0_g1_i1:87-5267(+)